MLKVYFLSAVLPIAFILAGCGEHAANEASSHRAIDRFHELFNGGKMMDIWEEANARFQATTNKEEFDHMMNLFHDKLGNAVSTSTTGCIVRASNYQDTRVLITQDTVYEKGHGTESFLFGISDGNARLLGYNIERGSDNDGAKPAENVVHENPDS